MRRRKPKSGLARLSTKEREAIELLRHGYRYKAAARVLGISVGAFKLRILSARSKLHCETTSDLIATFDRLTFSQGDRRRVLLSTKAMLLNSTRQLLRVLGDLAGDQQAKAHEGKSLDVILDAVELAAASVSERLKKKADPVFPVTAAKPKAIHPLDAFVAESNPRRRGEIWSKNRDAIETELARRERAART